MWVWVGPALCLAISCIDPSRHPNGWRAGRRFYRLCSGIGIVVRTSPNGIHFLLTLNLISPRPHNPLFKPFRRAP